MADTIIGRNAVMEALKSDREIEKLIVGKGAEGSIKKIIGMAKDKKIPVHYSDKTALDRIADGRPHQGVAAQVSAYTYCDVDDILARAEERGEDPFIIILDGLEDPHNLGAIMRTAECCGAHGIIIPKRRSVGLTETVAKASAGAIDSMRVDLWDCLKSQLTNTSSQATDKSVTVRTISHSKHTKNADGT